jgi:hypothetical protein
MIDLKTETLLPLSEAAKKIPPNRSGKKVHTSTVLRWILKGVKGVALEGTRLGGRWLTSLEALQRFGDRLATTQTGVNASPDTMARQHAADRAEEELAELGF